jgi:Cro/C1-type HTH DNA-binding domain
MRADRDWPAVAAAVRTRMAELDITTAELARKADLAPATVLRARKGTAASHGVTLRKLADGLGWSHGYLHNIASGKSPQTPQQPGPVTGALLSLPDFVRGTGLQGDVSHLAASVARDFTDGLTPAERDAAARFIIDVGIKMSALNLHTS